MQGANDIIFSLYNMLKYLHTQLYLLVLKFYIEFKIRITQS